LEDCACDSEEKISFEIDVIGVLKEDLQNFKDDFY
jgi:hypothetical protein